MKKNVEYEFLDYYECENADKTIDLKIKNYESLINGKDSKYKKNIQVYTILCDLYKKNKDEEKFRKNIDSMEKNFPEAYETDSQKFFYYVEKSEYNECKAVLNKLSNVTNLALETKEKKFSELEKLYSVFINPEKFEHIDKEFANKFSVDIVSYLFNNSYKNEKNVQLLNKFLAEINCADKEIPTEIILIKSLVELKFGDSEKGIKTFDSIFSCDEETASKRKKLSLCDMIETTENIFDISILEKLFINSKKFADNRFKELKLGSKELQVIYFYQNVLLSLLHSNYIKNNPQTEYISHYTSLYVLERLLDEKNLSSIRLNSLKNVNDPA